MKKRITMLLTMLLFAFMLIPAVTAQAETLVAPGAIQLNDQAKAKFQIIWPLDGSLNSYYSAGYKVGYNIQITDINDAVIAVYDSATYSDFGALSTNPSYCAINVENASLKKQPFKVKVNSYIINPQGQAFYSPVTEQVIVPRPTVKKGKVSGSNGAKITWNKVKGAKSYSVYLSKNNGKSFKKVATTKKTNTLVSGLKKYKDYYVYIQANKVKCNGQKLNSTKALKKDANSYGFYIYTTYR